MDTNEIRKALDRENEKVRSRGAWKRQFRWLNTKRRLRIALRISLWVLVVVAVSALVRTLWWLLS